MFARSFLMLLLSSSVLAQAGGAGEAVSRDQVSELAGGRHPGLELLLDKPFLPPDFDQEVFDQVWQVWPEPLRSRAAAATPHQRRELAYRRYGLVARPGDPQHRPMQYVVDAAGQWTMNCLACHQGTVAGRVVPGVANSQLALATLTEEIRAAKLRLRKPLSRMDVGSLFMPLGSTVGTTNAVMFGVVLMAYRDADLNVYPNRLPPPMTHHDHDAPAWWHFRRKEMLYSDGFVEKDHRALMPFIMVKQNGPEKFREWENDFREIAAYLESLRPPVYEGAVDQGLAAAGQKLFAANCADCHGSYGARSTWPGRVVPLEEVQTDPVRLRALSSEHRQNYSRSWLGHYGKHRVLQSPQGYVAPPLDGIWASAPYFHNGSVPTLWHLLHPEERPEVWRRSAGSENAYDHERMGLVIQELSAVPKRLADPAERRHFFDTRKPGKSAAGHDFPDLLSEPQKRAVLEYLKTL